MYRPIDPLDDNFELSVDAMLLSTNANGFIWIGLVGDHNDLNWYWKGLGMNINHYGGSNFAQIIIKYNDGTMYSSVGEGKTLPLQLGKWYTYKLSRSGNSWKLQQYEKGGNAPIKTIEGTLMKPLPTFKYVLFGNGDTSQWETATGRIDNIKLDTSPHIQDLIFKNVDLMPKTGDTVFANNEAYVVLKVENKGTANIPASNWNINLYFNDLLGVGSDLWETIYNQQSSTLVQERDLQFVFPEIPPGEKTIQIPILLSMRDPINYKDQYMAYADQLIACGNPVPQEIDCTNSNHRAVGQIEIASNIYGDSAGCIWDIFILGFQFAVKKAKLFADCPGASEIFKNIGLISYQVIEDSNSKEPDVPIYFKHVIDQVIALAETCKPLPVLEKISKIFDFMEDIYTTAGSCLSMITSWMVELTSIYNDAGIKFEMITINDSADVEVTIESAFGEIIHITGQGIINEIPGARTFFGSAPPAIKTTSNVEIPLVILVPGDTDLKIKVTSNKSSSIEFNCVGSKGTDSHVSERFIIDVIPGTILATTYSKDVGYQPMSVDYDGDDKIDYYAYPDTW